jgi:GNAT superfamily N-acetyltransferase
MRRAGTADADEIIAVTSAGFESYREFAPPAWRPPLADPELLRERLASPDVWAAVAEEEGGVRGVVAFRPLLTERWSGDPVQGVAHFWMLFVHPDWWRRGIGRSLHDLAVAEIAARGYRRARLWTPTGANAARALYSRAGWTEGESIHEQALGLDLTTYERKVEAARSS